MGGTCRILAGNLKGRDHMGDLDSNWRIISKLILKEHDVAAVNWIHLAQYKVKCRALVNTLMKFRDP
jgi:hypothetical protein